MDLVGNDVDTLHEEIEYLVCHLVGNDVDTLHEKWIHLVGFNFIRVIDICCTNEPLSAIKIVLSLISKRIGISNKHLRFDSFSPPKNRLNKFFKSCIL